MFELFPMGISAKIHSTDAITIFTTAGNAVSPSMRQLWQTIGTPRTRFHDLRHSYAAASIKSGDDITTVQENLGHATAAFTLDVYGHVTDQMKQASAARMEQFIKAVNV